jgi:hypothetical protein
MQSEYIGAINAASSIFDKIGAMPITSLIVLLILGPWVSLILITMLQNQRLDKLLKANDQYLDLIKSYEICCKNFHEFATYSVEKIAKVEHIAENNLFCPIARRECKPRDI